MKRFLVLLLAASTCSSLQAQQAVGIGTTTPNASAQLDVVSTTKGVLLPRMTTSQRTSIGSPAAGLLVYDNTLKEFYHYDGGSWRQMINSVNNLWKSSSVSNFVYNTTDSIGIGISAPQEKLDVNGRIRSNNSLLIDDAGAIVTFQNAGVDKVFMQLSGENLRVGTFSSNNSGKFIVRTNGFDRLFVDSAGNLSIGITYKVANGYKVSVNGKIMCEEVRVQLDADWPDYVFKPGYQLMPLEDLKTFIRNNNHLPGIVPAAEVKEKGIELGDMNKRMMEKIEELTLYILDLKKEIDLLKAKQQQ